MKTIILTLMLIMPSLAFADLGDTYKQSVAKLGGSGKPDRVNRCMYWDLKNYRVIEYFVKNECVAMILRPRNGKAYTIHQAQEFLSYNCAANQVWTPLAIPADQANNFTACWQTTDGLLLASLYPSGDIQFGYRWYVKAKGHLTEFKDDNTTAPVEDNNPTNDTEIRS